MTENHIDSLAKTIWDYMHMHHRLQKADVIFVLGSHDVKVAKWAAKLYLDGWAPLLLFSGNEGVGREISGFKGIPEAEHFARIAVEMGVPKTAILKEVKATNTGQNILFSSKLLADHKVTASKIIAVQKPYMERRTFATLKAQWPLPQPEFIVTSPAMSYEDYVSDPLYPKDYTINVMVGDLQRINEYPKLGYQIPQEIPEPIWQAYEELVRLGYSKHLIQS